MPKRIALAYSGGLDTSCAIPWLKENYDAEVLAVIADVGQNEDLEAASKKAVASGASAVFVDDLRDEFVGSYVFPAVRAGAVYEGRYLLGTSLARPTIAKYQVDVARREGADAVAHGCTGKGNDQVRFELAFHALAPDLEIIAPWRLWDIRSREDALAYAERHGVPVEQRAGDLYSRDQNLLHLSHEGEDLEDPWNAPPASLYRITRNPDRTEASPEAVDVGFEAGIPVSVDGEALGPAALLTRLNEAGARHGVGRVDIVENRLVGMKSRGVYETPGGTILHEAKAALQSLTLDRATDHFAASVALRYAELVYDGKWFSALREALDAFFAEAHRNTTGTVRVRLHRGLAQAVGRKSPKSLYREDFATFGADEVYRQADAEGFIRLFGLPERIRRLSGADAPDGES